MGDEAVVAARRGRAALAAASCGLFAVAGVVALRVRGGSRPLRVDRVASRLVDWSGFGRLLAAGHVEPLWDGWMVRRVAGVGLPAGAAAAAVVMGLVAWRRRDRRAMALCLLGPAVAVLLTDHVAKPIVDRHRGGGLAYPSGHATGAAAVAVVALLLLHRWGGARALVWFGPFAVALPVVMGLALIRLGVHYPTDVIGGTAVGAATVLALAAALGPQPPRSPAGRAARRWGSPGRS